jgi:hypothetical protein
MPVVPFETLPDSSRVWVFGSDTPLQGERADELLKGVDAHLAQWKAHGEPLTVGSQWRFDRFLVVAVDQSTTGASGCSIDGLFRVLQQLQRDTGANLVGGGRVFYRDSHGEVQCVSRAEVAGLVQSGAITRDSVIFDTTLTDLGTFRASFETRAKDSWVKELLAP